MAVAMVESMTWLGASYGLWAGQYTLPSRVNVFFSTSLTPQVVPGARKQPPKKNQSQ